MATTRLQEFLKWSIQMDPGRIDIQIARFKIVYVCSIKYTCIWLIDGIEWLQESRQKNRDDSPWSLLISYGTFLPLILLTASCEALQLEGCSELIPCHSEETAPNKSQEFRYCVGTCRAKSFLDFHNLYEMASIPTRSDGFITVPETQKLGTTSYKTSGAHHPVDFCNLTSKNTRKISGDPFKTSR